MTIGELKKKLKNIPNDVYIVIHLEDENGFTHLGVGGFEIEYDVAGELVHFAGELTDIQ